MYFKSSSTLAKLTHQQTQLSQDLNLHKAGLKSLMGVFRDRSQMLQMLKRRLIDLKNEPMNTEEIKRLEKEYTRASNWNRFLEQYEELHQEWLLDIAEEYSLTSNDKKILIMLKLQLNNSDMAAVMSVSLGGLKKAKSRLKKKINSSVFEELENSLINI